MPSHCDGTIAVHFWSVSISTPHILSKHRQYFSFSGGQPAWRISQKIVKVEDPFFECIATDIKQRQRAYAKRNNGFVRDIGDWRMACKKMSGYVSEPVFLKQLLLQKRAGLHSVAVLHEDLDARCGDDNHCRLHCVTVVMIRCGQ